MSRNMLTSLANALFGASKSPQPDMENGMRLPNSTDPELPDSIRHDYDGQTTIVQNERLFLFRHLTGITSHPSMTQSPLVAGGGRPAANLGIYARVVRNEMNAKRGYKRFSWLINGCLGLQIIVAAALTALGAANGNHSVITIFGAINTVIAGVLTFLKGSGLPNRLKYYQSEWKRIREFIEQRERDFSRRGCDLDVHAVITMIEAMYDEVKKDLEASTPDRFAGFGASRNQLQVKDIAVRDGADNIPRVGANGFVDKLKHMQSGVDDKVAEGNGLVDKLKHMQSGVGDKVAEGHGLVDKLKDIQAGFGHKAAEGHGLVEKLKDIQSGFGGKAAEDVKEKSMEHGSHLESKPVEGLKGKLSEFEADLVDRAKDLVLGMGHKSDVVGVAAMDLQTGGATISRDISKEITERGSQPEQLHLSVEDRLKNLVSEITQKAQLAHDVVQSMHVQHGNVVHGSGTENGGRVVQQESVVHDKPDKSINPEDQAKQKSDAKPHSVDTQE